MSQVTLEDWLRRRIPPIPAPFLPHLLEGRGEVFRPLDLESRGVASLAKALGKPGRDREAAFHLLAADAFLTYACEALAHEPDPRAALETLLGGLGDRFR